MVHHVIKILHYTRTHSATLLLYTRSDAKTILYVILLRTSIYDNIILS